MKPPMFSIITICLNNKDGLIRTYESLKSQSCDEYEWIVVDGVSTDGTIDFLNALPKSSEFTWSSVSDSGLYDAMNKGMALANGKYLLFLNSGDELANSLTLETVHSVSAEFDFDLIYGDALETVATGNHNYKSAYSYHKRWYGMFTHHQSMFYRNKCVGRLRYDLSYKVASDYAFTCKFLKGVKEVKYIQNPICLFEGDGLTSTSEGKFQGVKEQWRVGKEILERSFFQRLGVLILHIIKHILISFFPVLYSRLRYKK